MQFKRTIWPHPEQIDNIQIIDQRWLPHQLIIEDLTSYQEAATAIREMHVRGAPLIGATAAWGFYLACLQTPWEKRDQYFSEVVSHLQATRPTAVDLFHALDYMEAKTATAKDQKELTSLARHAAEEYTEMSVAQCRAIGEHGLEIIKRLYSLKKRPLNILTHCNAGWLACIEYGTATAPIYLAKEAGIPIHVWVDETRPRLQGARLTAYELGLAVVPHTVITDNSGGHLMQHGQVDLVIVGSDRTTRRGDVANKIGTYLKALAAKDNDIPFYVALPASSIDWSLSNGLAEIPIEERHADEVSYVQGQNSSGQADYVRISPKNSPAINHGFDVTPARLVTALITDRGVCQASEEGLKGLFGEESAN